MSLALLLSGIVLRFTALYLTIITLRKKRDWRLIVLGSVVTASLVHLFYWYGFSLSKMAETHIAVSSISLIYGAMFVVTVNIVRHYIEAFREKRRALSEHVNLFEQFAYTAPVACFIFQEDRIVFSNHAATALTGYSGSELRDLPPRALAHKNSRDYLSHLESAGSEDITSFETSVQIVSKEGETRWGLASFGSAMYEGNPATVGTILDVTQHKKSEQAIQEAEERIRMATNATNTVVWDYDFKLQKSKFVVPEALAKDFTFAQNQGTTGLAESIYEPDRELLEKTIMKAVGKNEGFEIDYRRFDNYGDIKWWRLEGKAQHDSDGTPTLLTGTARCIHDQKIVEESLKENEARLRLATEIAGIQVWEWDISSNEVHHNGNEEINTCGQVTGYQDFLERIHPDHQERVEKSVAHAIREGIRYEEEFPLRDNDGNYFWQHSVGQLLYDENGTPIQMIGAAIDTSERKKKDELIRFQADMLDRIGQSVIAQNAEGQLTYFNKAAQKAFALASEAPLPLDISGSIPNDQRIRSNAHIMKALKKGNQWAGEITAHSLNGDTFPIFMSASPLFSKQNEFDGFIAISTDLSDYKEIQEALRDSEERLRLALDAANLVVWDLDVKTGKMAYNLPSSIDPAEAEKFNSLQSIKTSFHPEDLQQAIFRLRQSLRKQKPYYMEHRILNSDNSFDWWQSSGKTFSDEKGKPVRMIGTTQMITLRKEAELQLQKRVHQLQAIYHLADAVNKAENLEYIYLTAADGAKKALDADKVAIYTFDEEDQLNFEFSDGLSKSFKTKVVQDCPWNTPAVSEKALYVVDVQSESALGKLKPLLEQESIKALASFPLIHKGEVLGKFVVYYDNNHELPLSDQQLATRIANHISLAIVKTKAENELRSRSLELQTIADTIPDSILRIGADLKMKFANKAVLQSVNMTQEEFVGLPATSFGCPPNLHNKWVTTILDVIEKGKLQEFDFYNEDPIRGAQNYHALIAPEYTTDKKADSVLAVLRNITEERQLQQTIIDMSARQQRRIGQDLHDELGQLLTGIGFKIAGLQVDLDKIDEACAVQAKEITTLVEQAISQTRMLAEGLNPVTLEVHGIRAGLEKLAINTENTFGIPCPFTCDEDFTIEDEETAVQLYRIGQEAVNNAIKHGDPTKINISLEQVNGKAELVVTDNGKGFVMSPNRSEGHGLRIMDYRARVIGAAFHVDSKPKKGTTVRCKFENNSPVTA